MSESAFAFSKERDAQYMARAIELAKRGKYTTTPNPNVGCVIVSPSGDIVGEGFHRKAGQGHAEVVALENAGDNAKGAIAYVTLEPCSHYGRTPPCAEALIKAGINRVVVAMQDPNPKVSGRGIGMLREAGIAVDCGVLEAAASKLNKGFLKRFRAGRPHITVKLAMSLDGRIALKNGVSQWITGAEARQDVQRHRAESCAILTGSGTVLADDPSLNIRFDELGFIADSGLVDESSLRQPARIVIDGKNQLTSDRKLYYLAGDTIVVNTQNNPLLPSHVTQWQQKGQNGKVELTGTVRRLAEQEYNAIWVEAGAKLAGALMQEQLVDELIVYIAPKLIGHEGRELIWLPDMMAMSDVLELEWVDKRQVGNDLKLVARPLYKSVE